MSLNYEIEKYGKELLSLPTTSFREMHVQKWVQNFCIQNKIDYSLDSWGNIWVGTKSKKPPKGEKIVFVAHMDHPGFHITKKLGKNLWQARWFGGGPRAYLKNAPVYIANSKKILAYGKIKDFKFNKEKGRMEFITIKTNSLHNLTHGFGSFDYPGFKKKGSLIYTKSADDLGGVLMTLILAKLLKKESKKTKNSFLGLLTRAEEVGFQGALAAIHLKNIPRNYKFISIETSNYVGRAKMGGGPVIRIGDKATVFDPEISLLIKTLAIDLKKKNKNFSFQVKLLDGGACEATPFNVFGYKASGIAVPLGGYHNEQENGRPGPEFIDINDMRNLILLGQTVVKNFSKKNFWTQKMRARLSHSFKNSIPLLKSAAST